MSNPPAPIERVQPGPGQQSVWDYPRPPKVATENRRVRLYVGGIPIVDSTKCLRVLETSHPPTIYVPTQDFKHCEIRRLKHQSECEYKGTATFFTIIAGGKIAHRAAWGYLSPHAAYRRLTSHLAVYPGRVDRAMLGDEEVKAQDGDFYGGWVTSDIVGPFKGEPGTEGW